MGDYPNISLAHIALTNTCPRCGEGKIYSGYLKVVDQCAVCGLNLKRHDSGDGPAFFVMSILGIVIIPLALVVEASYAPPFWVHLSIWPACIVLGCLWLLPMVKSILIAQEYKNQVLAGEFDEVPR